MKELDTQLKVHLRNMVTNYIMPYVTFVSHVMTNVVRGDLERRNLFSSFPSFWMPDLNDSSQEEKVAHLIVNKCEKGGVDPE